MVVVSNWGKVFLIINENDIYNQYDGEISEFSIIDYRWNEVPYMGSPFLQDRSEYEPFELKI